MVGCFAFCLVGWVVEFLKLSKPNRTEAKPNQTIDLILIFTIISDKQTISSNNNNVSKVIIRQNELKTHRLNLKLHTDIHTGHYYFYPRANFVHALKLVWCQKHSKHHHIYMPYQLSLAFFFRFDFLLLGKSQPSEARTKPENWARCFVWSR